MRVIPVLLACRGAGAVEVLLSSLMYPAMHTCVAILGQAIKIAWSNIQLKTPPTHSLALSEKASADTSENEIPV